MRRAALLTSFWGVVTVLITASAFALFGPAIIDLMTTSPEVRATARTLLPWMVAAPILGIAAWMLDGIFIGATATADMRNMMAVSAGIYAVFVIVLTPSLGNHGLWIAMLVCLAARGATLALRYPALEARADLPPDAR